jgi:hypothetical protein
MRSSGDVSHALAELSRRDEQVRHLSRRRLQGSAALHGYLATYYPGDRRERPRPTREPPA